MEGAPKAALLALDLGTVWLDESAGALRERGHSRPAASMWTKLSLQLLPPLTSQPQAARPSKHQRQGKASHGRRKSTVPGTTITIIRQQQRLI